MDRGNATVTFLKNFVSFILALNSTNLLYNLSKPHATEQPLDVLGHIRIDDRQRQIASVGHSLSGWDDAAQHPDVLLLEHQSTTGISAAGTGRLGIAGTDRVRGDKLGVLLGQISTTFPLGDDVRVCHLGQSRVSVPLFILTPTSHIGLVTRGQFEQKVLVPQTDGLDVIANTKCSYDLKVNQFDKIN